MNQAYTYKMRLWIHRIQVNNSRQYSITADSTHIIIIIIVAVEQERNERTLPSKVYHSLTTN